MPRSLYCFFSDLELPTSSHCDCGDRYDLGVSGDADHDEGNVLAIVVSFPHRIIDRG